MHAECPKEDIVEATGGEKICCRDDTCLVDVPSLWGNKAPVDVVAYYPKDMPYDPSSKTNPDKKTEGEPITLAPGTCTYPDKKKWLCKIVRTHTSACSSMHVQDWQNCYGSNIKVLRKSNCIGHIAAGHHPLLVLHACHEWWLYHPDSALPCTNVTVWQLKLFLCCPRRRPACAASTTIPTGSGLAGKLLFLS